MKSINDILDIIEMKIIQYEDMERLEVARPGMNHDEYLRRVRFIISVLKPLFTELQSIETPELALDTAVFRIKANLEKESILDCVLDALDKDWSGGVRQNLWRVLNSAGYYKGVYVENGLETGLPPDDIVLMDHQAQFAANTLRKLSPRADDE